MYRGIDVSNWDKDHALPLDKIDFLIAKASEGTYFYDSTCYDFINQARQENKLLGVYHFAAMQNAEEEAQFFYDRWLHFTDCMPFLDFEVFTTEPEDVKNWCEAFISKFYNLSGIMCGLYISASLCPYFANSWIPGVCPLWVAGYPENVTVYDFMTDYPYNIAPWSNVFIWQFSSLLFLGNKCFDGDTGYFTREEWIDHTHKIEIPGYIIPFNHEEEYLHEACRVVLGEYGIGEERKNALRQNGYDPNVVQHYVNDIMAIIGE